MSAVNKNIGRTSAPPARRSAPQKPSRGRPSRTEKERILREEGKIIANEFCVYPLRAPVDPQFEPYCEQILNGNAAVIIQYCDAITRKSDVGSSFCELLGRLVTMRSYRVADMILRDVERRGVMYWPSDRKSYLYWYGKLKPLCGRARGFIRSARESATTFLTREDLWRKYVFQRVPTVPFVEFMGDRDKDHLNRNGSARQHDGRCRALQELLQWEEAYTIERVTAGLKRLGASGRELRKLAEGNYHLEHVNRFAAIRTRAPRNFLCPGKDEAALYPSAGCPSLRFSNRPDL